MIEGIPARLYPPVRHRCLPFLENFVARSMGRWTVEDLENDVLDSSRQLWRIGDFQALAMTALDAENVIIDAAAGVRRHEWQDELDRTLREWGKALGKRRIIAFVRRGWEPFGRSRGYRVSHVEMTVDL